MAIWRQPPRAQQPKNNFASLLPPQYYRALTIDHTLVPNTDQTDFPVLVSLTHTSLKTIANGGHVANSSGFDILFYSDSNLTTRLSHEIEKYDAATGEVIMWVKLPTVSHTTDTVFYMKYGDISIGASQENVAAVWSNSFAGVWHLGSASSLNSVNSVSAGSGSITGATAASGKINGAGNFVGATDKIVTDLTTNSVQRTYTVWARRHGEGGGGHGRIFQKGTTGSRDTLFVESPSVASTYEFLSNHNPGFGDWAFPKPSVDVFHYIVVAYDASSNSNDPTARVDKVDQTITRVAAPTGSPNGGTEAYNIGNRLTNDRNWDGDIDEFRIADVIRSNDWTDTEYNNQNSPSSFLSLGTELAVGAPVITLVIQNAAHAHTAQNLALTQVHSLTAQNASHSHTAQNLSLTQVHLLTVQNASHSHTAANLTLTQVHNLTVQNASHSHTAGNLALTQVHSLVVQNASHAHSAANTVLTQVHLLIVQSASHSHTAENLVINVSTNLTIANAAHSHTAGNLVLTQIHNLAVQNAAHSHAAANVNLTQVHNLTVQDANHAHTAQNLILTQAHNLTVAGASHTHSAENVVLVAQGTLGIQNATHGHTVESLGLTQVHGLAIQNGSHAHSAQNVSLIVDLAIQSAQHGHFAANITLTQTHALIVQNASHAHAAENAVLTQTHILTVQDGTHGHTANSLVLGQVHFLAISGAQHAHAAENLALTQVQNLVIANSFHLHTADEIHFRKKTRTLITETGVTISTTKGTRLGVRSGKTELKARKST
jgi:hypothetical protein